MPSPIIGVSTFHLTHPEKDLRYVAVTESYVQALLSVGAVPVLIPPGLDRGALERLLDGFDGLLLPGGGDLDPALYGAPQHPLIDNVDPQRDHLELELSRLAALHRVPFLGICRGIQTMNVALGGTLYPDIRSERPEALKHDCFEDAPRSHLAHTVEVRADSQLARIFGTTRVEVNSGHHQAIRQPAAGVKVTAIAPDGVIEALELQDHPFGLAVQWHPEWLMEHPPMVALFKAFADASSRTHDSSSQGSPAAAQLEAAAASA
jgi:putative glutamine amidotransferase